MTTTTAAPAPTRRGGHWLALAGWIGLSLLAGAIGGIASLDAREFYAALHRPSWAPPGWLFGPVWTALYVMMGVAAWLVWREPPSDDRRRGLALFVAQLALNALWTWLFFAWRAGALASAEIVLLWVAIASVMVLFGRVRRPAAWLLLPYLAWVTYASALTFAVWRANPGSL